MTDRIVERSADGAHAELPLEADGHVGEDQQEREQHRERTLLGELLADLRADDLGTAQLDARVGGLDGRRGRSGRAC